MKNEVIVKVNKVGKTGQIITEVGKIILVIGFIACILVTAIFVTMPKDMVTMELSNQFVINLDLNERSFISILPTDISDNTSLELNGINYEVTAYEESENGVKIFAGSEAHEVKLSNMPLLMIPALLFIVATYVVLHYVGRLCKAFRYCQTPFTDEIVHTLKKLAISIIPMTLLSSITNSVTDSIMTGNLNIILGVDLMTIMLVVLIFMLAAIFKYGTMLQIESDETL